MLPVKSFIRIDRSLRKPVYLQISDAIIREIKMGRINPGEKLPGTRKLAETLDIHRNTAVTAYDELKAQQWIKSRPAKGTFVKTSIPDISPRSFSTIDIPKIPEKAGYEISSLPFFSQQHTSSRGNMPVLDGGLPDVRLSPTNALASAYRRVMKRGLKLTYGDESGDLHTREIFSDYLNKTRGLQTGPENLLITRGSQMAFFLAISTVLKNKDNAIVAEKSYPGTEHVFQWMGVNLLRVPLDSNGMKVNELKKMCKKKNIKAVYVIPHHQYPTTVSLAPERRLKLLSLAEEYDFAILEDDYDFDFHYKSAPILPLASSDSQGRVIYTGSFSKIIAPAFRVGFMVAPINIITKAKAIRRIIDRQGDQILERALAELIKDGDMHRHLRKSRKKYHHRRDYFCKLLEENFADKISFQVPDGGMALWIKFSYPIDLEQLSQKLQTNGFFIKENIFYKLNNGRNAAMRIGFASLTKNEMKEVVQTLSKLMK